MTSSRQFDEVVAALECAIGHPDIKALLTEAEAGSLGEMKSVRWGRHELGSADAAPLLCAGVTTYNALRNAGLRVASRMRFAVCTGCEIKDGWLPAAHWQTCSSNAASMAGGQRFRNFQISRCRLGSPALISAPPGGKQSRSFETLE